MTGWLVRGIGLPDGDPVEAGITADGKWVSTPEIGAEVLPGRFVLPGLVDAHCHLSVGQGKDGWPARDQPPQPPSPTYPLHDVRRLVDAVHSAGARVAAHTTTGYATELIEAGIDSVEHGIALEETDLDKLAAAGGGWTPTLCAALATRPDDDPDRRRPQLDLRDRLRHLLPTAANRGVTIMTGTDVVGTIPREVALLTELGLPPSTALAAASTSARKFLGFPDIRDGAGADLVTYDDDPRDDPEVLARPTAVFLAGTRLR